MIASLPAPASAAWHKASSKHFIIYADEKPEKLAEFAAKLEKFDKAVRLVRKMKDRDIGDGNRLTVYVVRDVEAVRKLIRHRSAGGFYIGRATGPMAVVPREGLSAWGGWEFSADTIFFHEYAHHLMFQEIDSPLPEWLIEGFAEMMSTAKFEKDGALWLGRAAQHRADGMFWGEQMPLEMLLSAKYGRISEGLQESIYGRGWLLTHFLNFDPARRGQLDKYVNALEAGTSPLDAARQAFGDLKILDRDLTRYAPQRKLNALRVPGSLIKPPPISVTPLSAGAAAVLPLRLQSKMGVNETTAEPLAVKVRAIQARHPSDAQVEVTLAEAELDSQHPEASEAAADRALAVDPRNTEAMIYKGRALAAKAIRPAAPDKKLMADARTWFMKANSIDSEDPEPLMEYFRSYIDAREMPTKNAVDALHYASNLAPQDAGLRLNSAIQYLRDKDLRQARQTIVPIAYSPHGQQVAIIARSMIERIDAGDAEGALKAAQSQPKEETVEAGQ